MFNEENLQPLFRDLSRWGMTIAQGKNCLWVIRRHNWDDDEFPTYRFTIDQETETHNFRRIERDTVCAYERSFTKQTAKQDLIEFLKVVNLWEGKTK